MKKIQISWTYTRWTEPLRVSDLLKHELKPSRIGSGFCTGGLGYEQPWGTRLIDRSGRLHLLRPEQEEINLYLEGGLDWEFRFRDTFHFCTDQVRALSNELRSLLHSHPGSLVLPYDLRNFDLDLWLTASKISGKK